MKVTLRKQTIMLRMIFSCVLAGASTMYAAQGNRIHIRQNVFELSGDSVHIEMTVRLNGTQVDSRSYVRLTPVLRIGSGMERALPAIQINGRNRHKAYKRLVALGKQDKTVETFIHASNKETTQTYIYKTSFLFEPWMEKAELLLHEDQCDCSGPLIPMSFELLAKNMDNRNPPAVVPIVEYTPLLAVTFVTPEVEIVKRRSEAGKAYLDYPVGVSTLYPDFRDNARQLQQIYNLIDKLKGDASSTITGVTITGYASPEGTYQSNLTLSGKRALALTNHLKRKYAFAGDLLHSEGMGEDWQTLDSLVDQSELRDKQQILSIIRNVGVFDGREKRLMNLSGGAPYREMLQRMFPRLRRSDYELSYTVAPFTVEQGKEVMKTRPSSLSLNEMFLIANTFEPGSDAFNEVIETAARIFPQDNVANLNAAASALNRKDLQTAEKYLHRVTTVNDAAYLNNAGVLAGLKKEYALAAEYFSKAKAAGSVQAVINLDEIEKTKQQ